MTYPTHNTTSDIIKAAIRTIPDYPKAGIQFRDITTLLANPDAFRIAIDSLVQRYLDKDIQWVAGIEARGFVFGSVIAYELGVAFLPIRKAGKLPCDTIGESYELEYGQDRLEIHTHTLQKNDRVILVDDLIATGGTATAAIHLIRQAQAKVVESCFIVDLPDLHGSQRIENIDCPCYSLCQFDGE